MRPAYTMPNRGHDGVLFSASASYRAEGLPPRAWGSNLDAHSGPKTEVRMLLSFQRPARRPEDGDSVHSRRTSFGPARIAPLGANGRPPADPVPDQLEPVYRPGGRSLESLSGPARNYSAPDR